MDQDIYHIVTKVLEIAEFEGNREEYAASFIQGMKTQAFLALLSTLPPAQQSQVRQQLEAAQTADAAKTIILQYFTPAHYEQQLRETSNKMFTDLLNAVWPNLITTKQWQLSAFLDTLHTYQ